MITCCTTRTAASVLGLCSGYIGAKLGDPERDTGPGRVARTVISREHGVHPQCSHHEGVVAVLIELLTGALPQLLVGDRRT